PCSLLADTPVIVVNVKPLEGTRTPNSGLVWEAECKVAGKVYTARSRHGAPNALARGLGKARLPHDEMVFYYSALAGRVRYASFHRLGAVTYSEGVSTVLHKARHQEYPRGIGAAGEAVIGGSTPAATLVAGTGTPSSNTAPLSVTRCVRCAKSFVP